MQRRSCGKRQFRFAKEREIQLRQRDLNPAQEGFVPTLSMLLPTARDAAGAVGCTLVASLTQHIQSIAEVSVLVLNQVLQRPEVMVSH